MPQISYFFGIAIKMYWNDHLPMHFHAEYAEHIAKIEIEEAKIIEGYLPPRIAGFVIEWTLLHKEELKENWSRCKNKEALIKIEPLQ